MIRALYSLCMRLAQPFVRRKLARRALAEPGYAEHVGERFGHYTAWPGAAPSGSGPGAPGLVWIHAVSLGETRAAAVLVARLRDQLPGFRLLLTHGTATGRTEGARLLQPGDAQVWQPWDAPDAVCRFLRHFEPRIGILMETEVWPNLAAACQASGIPLVLANARMSEKSLAQSLRLAWLARPAYAALTAVWAQTDADAARLRRLGAPVQGVLGNLKFDATPQAAQLAVGRAWRQAVRRPVILLASSREGEEAIFLQNAWQKWRKAIANIAQIAPENIANSGMQTACLLIVPRHPQRFDAVAALIEAQGFAVLRRSLWPAGGPSPDAAQAPDGASGCPVVWLGDSLGEMSLYYGLADVALLGGSFEPLGGQNLIEAAACECPVVMGPHTFNFADAALLAEQAGAALRVNDLAEGMAVAASLAGDAARLTAAQQAAQSFSRAHRGATAQLAGAICELLSATPPTSATAKEPP